MATLNQITDVIQNAIDGFDKRLPAIQRAALDDILLQLKNLDVKGKTIQNTVKNIRLIAAIKNRMQKIILSDEYKGAVKQYVRAFNDVTKLQNEYFRDAEVSKSAMNLGKVLKEQSIGDTVKALTEAGIEANIGDRIYNIIKENVTTGSSYASLTKQITESLTDTETSGVIRRYVKGIVVDSINTYSAQYMNNISNDLGYEWFRYAGHDIDTTRPFCDAMTDIRFFHVTEIPAYLRGEGLTYTDKEGNVKKVELYHKTGLPHGMKDGTDASNFMVRRGGWNCGHQVQPVNERRVPDEIKERVFQTPAYRRWKNAQNVLIN